MSYASQSSRHPNPPPAIGYALECCYCIVFPRREVPALTRLKAAAARQSDGRQVWDAVAGVSFDRRESMRLRDRSSSTPLLVVHKSSFE
jgi:hypothetical protein